MKITRKLDTTNATYDLTGLTDGEFKTLVESYEYYMRYIQRFPPKEDDSMWTKMQKLMQDRITIV